MCASLAVFVLIAMLNDLGYASACMLRFRILISFVYLHKWRMDVFIIMLRGWRYSLQDWRANIKNCHQEFMSVFRISVLSLGFFCEYSVKNYHHQEFNVNFIYKISVSSSGYSCEYSVKTYHNHHHHYHNHHHHHQEFNV